MRCVNNVVAKSSVTLQRRGSRKRADTSDAPYDRQIRFFSQILNSEENGIEAEKRLRGRRILIAGLGGYGTWIAALCARIGIETIIAVDSDFVERSNLGRQILYGPSDVGSPKVEIVGRELNKSSPDVKFFGYRRRVENSEDVVDLLKEVDLAFIPFGYIPGSEARRGILGTMITACLSTGTPSLVLGANAMGPLNIPGLTACYWCALSVPRIRKMVKGAWALSSRQDPMPAFAPRLGMLASAGVWEAARFLSGSFRSPLLDNFIFWDTWRYEHSLRIPVRRIRGCSDCARAPLGRGRSNSARLFGVWV